MDRHRPEGTKTADTRPGLRVCFIAGNDRTLHCGVKDYAHRLAEALDERGITAEVYAPANWSLRSFLRFRTFLRSGCFDVIHVQYPSLGYRYSLFPHLLGFAEIAPSACLTLHEYSRLPRVQRWLTQLFRFSSKMLVFSTEEEQASFESLGGSLGSGSAIIPIGSNLPIAVPPPVRLATVVYFGQIRPDKGLDAFLKLARLSLEQGRRFQFAVLGASLPKHTEYVTKLREQSIETVEWRLDQPSDTVARQIAEALAAYLPFPDGATYRRGSLVGAMVNGTPIITTISSVTPLELRQAVLAAESANEALARLDQLDASAELQIELSERGRVLGSRFSWSTIAEAHELLYKGLSAPMSSGAERGSGAEREGGGDLPQVKRPKVVIHSELVLPKEHK